MKAQVLIVLLLTVGIYAKSRLAQEEEGDGERDVIMEYRILAKGTFSVASFLSDDDSEDEKTEYAQFPNYCKHQLDDAQFTSLSTKASVYLQCWHDVVDNEVADLAGCEEAMASCSEALAELELTEQEDDGEEGEGDAEDAPEEEEEEEEGEECVEGEECDESEEVSSAEEVSDEDGEVFVKESTPLLTPVQATCFYYVITKNLENKDGSLTGPEILETEGIEAKVFRELTFHQDLRTQISWLEFWLYMCNGDENVLLNFEANPLLSSKAKAFEVYERLNPHVDEEEEAERKVVRHAKITKKAVKSQAQKILKSKKNNLRKLKPQ